MRGATEEVKINKKQSIIKPLWEEAGKRLKSVTEVIAVGCSFREGDERFIDLLREKIKWSFLENFVVVEPKEDVRKEIKDKFGREIDEPLGDMEKLAEYLEKKRQKRQSTLF